jgi:diacylglycerol kinase family enzyme
VKSKTPGTLVIVNPNAARVRDAAARLSLADQLTSVLSRRDGRPPRIVETAAPAETAPIVQAALADGLAAVVGVGGDGTLRDIAAALAGTGVPLGVIPAGAGNQVAAVLRIPLSLDDATAALATARPRSIDLAEVTLHLTHAPATRCASIIGCGAGFDARLMATTPDSLKRRIGRFAYLAQAVRLALRIEAAPCRITIDGDVIETETSIVLVGNMGQLVPGRLDLRLPIRPDDGLLDLIAVGAHGPIHGLRGLLDQLLRTSVGGGSGSDSIRLRGRSITVEPETPEPLEVDGDYVGEGSLEARILADALAVLVPSGAR